MLVWAGPHFTFIAPGSKCFRNPAAWKANEEQYHSMPFHGIEPDIDASHSPGLFSCHWRFNCHSQCESKQLWKKTDPGDHSYCCPDTPGCAPFCPHWNRRGLACRRCRDTKSVRLPKHANRVGQHSFLWFQSKHPGADDSL